MKVLITGASGFIGSHLCNKLKEQGHDVHVLSRSVAKAAVSLGSSYKFFQWNSTQDLPPKEAFEGVDVVMNLAGENIADKKWTEEQKKRMFDSRVLTTQNLMKGINEYKVQLKAFVQASAIGVYKELFEKEITEEGPLANDFLGMMARKWEEAVEQDNPLLGRVSILRLGVVLGRGGGALEQMLPAFKFGAGATLSFFGSQFVSWVHIDDVVGMFIEAATNDKFSGVINCVSKNPVTNKKMSKALGNALKRPVLMSIPGFVVEQMFGEMSQILLSSQKVIPAKAQEYGYSFQYSDINQAMKSLV